MAAAPWPACYSFGRMAAAEALAGIPDTRNYTRATRRCSPTITPAPKTCSRRGCGAWCRQYRDGLRGLDPASNRLAGRMARGLCSRKPAIPPPLSPPLAEEIRKGGRGARLGRFGRRDLADHQADVAGADMDRRPVGDAAFEDLLGQRVLQLALDHPLQRPRAVDRVVAGIGQPGARRVVDLERDLAIGQQLVQPAELDRRRSPSCRRATGGGTAGSRRAG